MDGVPNNVVMSDLIKSIFAKQKSKTWKQRLH